MKIYRDIQQGSVDWSILRSGRVTASEIDNLVTPTGKIRTGDMPKTYLLQKVAEAWTGGPLASLNVWDVEQGAILEEWARPAFTLETGMEVERVGFIEADDPRVGCSPDGIINGEIGLEIKCPRLPTHIRYLLDGIVPPDYVIQVQGSLFVTKFPKWVFYSYRRRMPPLMLMVEPDQAIQKAISDALASFMGRFDEAMASLIKLNGGPPNYQAHLHPRQSQDDGRQTTKEQNEK